MTPSVPRRYGFRMVGARRAATTEGMGRKRCRKTGKREKD